MSEQTLLTEVPPLSETPPSSEAGLRDARPADIAALRRRELADFLRNRRERIAPEDVGLPPGHPRRADRARGCRAAPGPPPPYAWPAPRGGRHAGRGRRHLVHVAGTRPGH